MTHIRNTSASPTRSRPVRGKTTLPPDGTTGRARRAREEPMAVRPLRDDRYVVETDHGTYVVDVETGTCTCPDHAIRGARCKHLRRVGLEIGEGMVPAPGYRRAVCAVCGRPTFVPTAAAGPALCERHRFEPGDVVTDRETDGRLVVTRVTDRRADETATREGRLVSEYETNAAYGDHEPVVEAVYLDSARPGRSLAAAPRYLFPASRLRADDHGRSVALRLDADADAAATG